MLRMIIFVSITIAAFLLNADAFAEDTGGYLEYFSVSLDDESVSAEVRRTFKFQIITPIGEKIGYNPENGTWSGNVRSSNVSGGSCKFAHSDHSTMYENTCFKLFDFGSLYCPNDDPSTEMQKPEVYSASNYNFSYGCNKPGDYLIKIFPEAKAIINVCYSFDTKDSSDINALCSVNDFTRRLIITTNYQPELIVHFDYLTLAKNTIEKVITSSLPADEWEGCYHLGFIKNYGIYNSVSKKLSEAKKKYDAGDIKTAKNIYNAVINEIQAQYEKNIDKQCADILSEDLNALLEK